MTFKTVKSKCPCCGSKEIIDEFSADNCRSSKKIAASYLRCATCGSLYVCPSINLDKKKDDYDERYSTTYDKLVKKLKRKWYRFFVCRMYGLLSGFSHIELPRGGVRGDKLLDIGCGIGLQTKLLQRRGMIITGVDSSAQAIRLAEEVRDGEEFICGDFLKLDSDEKFDFIRLDNVIEHIGNTEDFFLRVSQMLKPRGKLIIFTPNADSFSLKFLMGRSISAWPAEHAVLFSKKGLMLLLERSGLIVEKIYRNTPSWWLAYNFLILIGLGNKVTADSFLLKMMSLFFLPLSYILNFIKLNEEIIVVAERI